ALTEVRPGRTMSVEPSPASERIMNPLDALLASAARSFGARTLAVVLTGFGHDGTEGARAVKQARGAVIVQSEASAEHPAMPRAVVVAGAADLVLGTGDIGPAIAQVVGGEPMPAPEQE